MEADEAEAETDSALADAQAAQQQAVQAQQQALAEERHGLMQMRSDIQQAAGQPSQTVLGRTLPFAKSPLCCVCTFPLVTFFAGLAPCTTVSCGVLHVQSCCFSWILATI